MSGSHGILDRAYMLQTGSHVCRPPRNHYLALVFERFQRHVAEHYVLRWSLGCGLAYSHILQRVVLGWRGL
ncbi:hypothetical protein KCU65_g182, partial [Aureobasidium melanogenum]